MGKSHWHVLGAGAIGCLFADALTRSGSKSTLVMRSGTKQKALPVIVERDNVRYEQQLDVVTPKDKERISHLLVTTKAYDVRKAVASVAHLVTEDSVVLLGWGSSQVGHLWVSDALLGVLSSGRSQNLFVWNDGGLDDMDGITSGTVSTGHLGVEHGNGLA